jgi:hypothetical protein
MLMHADNIDFSDELSRFRAAAPKEITKKGDDRSPPWSWLGCLYHDGTHISMPADNLSSCLRQAGATIPIPGTRGKTLKEASQSGLFIPDEHLKFTISGKQIPIKPILKLRDLGDSPDDVFPKHQSAIAKMGFKLFVKRAKISNKSKHVRVRPQFTAWAVTGELQIINEDVLTPTAIEAIFAEAGKKGLGDWRPGCPTPGPWGQFEVTLS